MTVYDTSKQIPICNLKKSTGFYLCYKSGEVIHAILKCWYGSKGDFFFYPNMSDYETTYNDNTGSSTIKSSSEIKHPRITIHASSVVVGPDKLDREKGHKYEELPNSIKNATNGIQLATHKLADPGHYKELSEKNKNKGNWLKFNIVENDVQPVITIDAYPIFNDTDINKVK